MVPVCFSMYVKKTKVKRPEQHKLLHFEIGWKVNKQGGTGHYETEKKRL